ncbi:MAG: CoA-binding protein, partial [Hyphomicrobiales bacterium]
MAAEGTKPLRRLLSPGSIAVIGGWEAARVVRQCELLGFEGEIWPVHPSRADLNSRPCYRRLEDLPGVPDAAFIAIPREPTIEAVRVLADMGAGGAVCYASGFAEVGDEGAELQAELVEAAGAMPIVGPNCYGCVNALDRLALWPDNHGLEPIDRGAAIITQSGNMGINFTMGRRGLPLACLLSLGNHAALGVTDCLEALLEDDRIGVIGLHIEGLDDVARFSRVAIRAREQGVPIVALKSGCSEKGAQATVSHTSTLSGADALYHALFARCGIARVHSVPAFLESLKLLSLFGPLPGNRIASLSCSGGEASLMADRTEGTGLVFPDLEPDHAAHVRASLNDYVEIANPLDYHTFIWGNRDATYATFSAMLSGGFDLTMLLLDFPTNESADCTDWI